MHVKFYLLDSANSRLYPVPCMLKSGILNPQINSLLSRVRHTNLLVIADRGFPFFPMIETIDITLVDDLPTVLQVLAAIRQNFNAGHAHMAREFLEHNDAPTQAAFNAALKGISVTHLPHPEFKQLVPRAIGLIRSADTIPYANLILESA
jgi:D-ribose pyranase